MVSAVIVQARATSTRLPGKVLADLAGAPLLTRVLERLRLVRGADVVCVATTANATDDPVAELARAHGAEVFRGSEEDVLSPLRGRGARRSAPTSSAASPATARSSTRAAVDDVIDGLAARRATHDYASNRLVRRLPRGLDAEAIWTDALLRTDRMATSRPAREHVTWLLLSRAPRPLRAARRGARGRGRQRPALDRRHARRPGDGAPALRTTSTWPARRSGRTPERPRTTSGTIRRSLP